MFTDIDPKVQIFVLKALNITLSSKRINLVPDGSTQSVIKNIGSLFISKQNSCSHIQFYVEYSLANSE